MSRSTRAIITRTLAVIPSLLVILLVNETGVDFLIITTQVFLFTLKNPKNGEKTFKNYQKLNK